MKRINHYSTKKAFFLFFVFAVVFGSLSCSKDETASLQPRYPEQNNNGEPVYKVFESRIPCSDCERTKVGIAIYKNEQTNLPATYLLSRIYYY